MPQKSTLLQNIILLQSYYKFLYLGKFLEKEIKDKDFSADVKDIKAVTWESSYFMIRGDMIKPILQSIHKHPDKKAVDPGSHFFGIQQYIGRGRFPRCRHFAEKPIF